MDQWRSRLIYEQLHAAFTYSPFTDGTTPSPARVLAAAATSAREVHGRATAYITFDPIVCVWSCQTIACLSK